MNSLILANDFRRRSIRIQRDAFLEQIRREEELEQMTIPKRFILDAEERARERVADQNWKRNFAIGIVICMGIYILYKVIRYARSGKDFVPNPEKEIEANSEKDFDPKSETSSLPERSEKRNVRFQIEENSEKEFDPNSEKEIEAISEEEYLPTKLELLMEDYPDCWREFRGNASPDWLFSDVTGEMSFDFFDEDRGLAVDYEPGDFFQFPNSITNDEIRFQNLIYDKKMKRCLCEENNVEYVELTTREALCSRV